MRKFIFFALMLFFMQHSFSQSAMKTIPTKTSIDVAQSHSELWANIKIANTSDKPILILKEAPNIFIDLGEKEIKYIGPSVQRAEYTLKDYSKINPQNSISWRIEISKLYEFLPGDHTYIASIGSGYYPPKPGEEIEGPEVTSKFRYNNR